MLSHVGRTQRTAHHLSAVFVRRSTQGKGKRVDTPLLQSTKAASTSSSPDASSAPNRVDPWDEVFEGISPKIPPKGAPVKYPRLPPNFFNGVVPSGRRPYSTQARDHNLMHDDLHSDFAASAPEDDFFAPLQAPKDTGWDHLFQDLDTTPPVMVSPHHHRGGIDTTSPPRIGYQQRVPMTNQETKTFDQMFTVIFDSTKKMEYPTELEDLLKPSRARRDPLADIGIGNGPGRSQDMRGLFNKLRRTSKKVKDKTETDELVDRKKQEMEECGTDQKLMEWAVREVFAEKPPVDPSFPTPQTPESEKSTTESSSVPKSLMHSQAYPYLLGELMRAFRTRFNDPHSALALFHHARNISIISYVLGCTTSAYNELLRTRWQSFRDLHGVADALEEMRVNGVIADSQTNQFVEELRRDLGRMKAEGWVDWAMPETDTWELLAKIEMLGKRRTERRPDRDSRDRQSADRDSNQRKGNRRREAKPWREAWKLGDTHRGPDRLEMTEEGYQPII
ncbi:hypothetical protein BOTBODRAFT_60484 [Botryobasidium botryosum FD-172 SS1]|uniref:Mtf2-like C-terminal domain-containing protein n=1 Tax=Botryobasidium botryosum (strain FD-172 SS1) TaxID=930990 RepID=A0A067M543_BOTB1|nr:hypothetical protein BOTBODRAFT_60484 [Botryobasidium botryosum FD-172 SS1]